MTDFYTDQYDDETNSYQGPMGERPGQLVAVYAQFANTAADPFGANAGDVLHVCKVAPGSKLIEWASIADADMDTDNDFTFNLGFTSDTTAFASASAGLQATTAHTLATSALLTAAAAVAGDELLLSRQAGELEAAGTLHCFAVFLTP